ncbi:hypothetical protein FACS189431_2150 [Alphaproteobacteria bacterium]|nr:hypothetical protein FACS189431_2150 [Alphaproteobacteria bacterium]
MPTKKVAKRKTSTSSRKIVSSRKINSRISNKVKIAIISSVIALGGSGGGIAIYNATTTPTEPNNPPTMVVEGGYKISQERYNRVVAELGKLAVRADNYNPELSFSDVKMLSWLDLDGNKCHARQDILIRDLTSITTDGCDVLTGILLDPYTAQEISYTKGSNTIDIDHVVAKKDAWNSGGWQWDYAGWKDFVNDPEELLAVSASANRSKGDKNAAEWLPTNESFRCLYVAIQVDVKTKYTLSVTNSEKNAISTILSNNCQIE